MNAKIPSVYNAADNLVKMIAHFEGHPPSPDVRRYIDRLADELDQYYEIEEPSDGLPSSQDPPF